MPTFTVKRAEHKKAVEGKHGPMQVIALSFEDGTQAEWFTKAATPVPDVGSTLEGDLEDGPYGKKFKKAFQQGGGGRGRSPADTRAIQRQHSQEMAIRAIALAGPEWAGKRANEDLRATIKDWTDWFERDIGADVGGGGGDESRTTRGLPDATGSAAADVSATPSDKANTTKKFQTIGCSRDEMRRVVHAIAGDPPTKAGLEAINAAIDNQDWTVLFDDQGIERPAELPDVRDLQPVVADDSTIL